MKAKASGCQNHGSINVEKRDTASQIVKLKAHNDRGETVAELIHNNK